MNIREITPPYILEREDGRERARAQHVTGRADKMSMQALACNQNVQKERPLSEWLCKALARLCKTAFRQIGASPVFMFSNPPFTGILSEANAISRIRILTAACVDPFCGGGGALPKRPAD